MAGRRGGGELEVDVHGMDLQSWAEIYGGDELYSKEEEGEGEGEEGPVESQQQPEEGVVDGGGGNERQEEGGAKE